MRVLAATIAMLALTTGSACSGAGGGGADPAATMRQAASAMAALKTVTADVRFGPGIVFQGFALQSANARLARTGESDTVIKVKQNDFLVDIRIVTTGGKAYLKVPFSKFQELTPAQAGEVPDLGALMDSQRGLPSVLARGQKPHDAGSEQIGGADCTHIDTIYSAEQTGAALGGLKPAGDIKASIWIGKSDHLVRRVSLAGPLVDAGKPTTVQVDLHDFNAPLTVETPAA